MDKYIVICIGIKNLCLISLSEMLNYLIRLIFFYNLDFEIKIYIL